VLAALLLLACGSPSAKKSDEPSAALKAAETNTALGRQYIERGQYEVALEKLKRAVAYEKSYAPAHTMLGVLYETLGMMEQSGDEYRLAVQYDTDDGETNNNYAAFLCRQGNGDEAQRFFQAAFADPFYETPWVAYANAGLCALDMDQLDKAETYLRQSLEYDAEIAGALLAMASLNYRKAQYLSARAFLQRFEAVAVRSAQSLLLGYQIENAMGDSSAANRYRNKLLTEFPKSAEAEQVGTPN
jgi:type IV pilus assembly protein PilF